MTLKIYKSRTLGAKDKKKRKLSSKQFATKFMENFDKEKRKEKNRPTEYVMNMIYDQYLKGRQFDWLPETIKPKVKMRIYQNDASSYYANKKSGEYTGD